MGMIRVRALQECFVLGSRWKVGAVFNVPEDTILKSKGDRRAPVMELVDPEPSRSRSKGGKFKKKAAKADETSED